MDDETTNVSEQAEDPAPAEPAAEGKPPMEVLDEMEKYLEAELPPASFLIVQTACAEIRKHLQ